MSSTTTTTQQDHTNFFQRSSDEEVTTCFFHLYGIVANAQQPFKIVVEEQGSRPRVQFESHTNLSPKNYIIKRQFKKPMVNPQHIVKLNVQIPVIESRLSAIAQRLNLTEFGSHVLIAVVSNGSNNSQSTVQVGQSHDGNFGPDFSGAQPLTDDQIESVTRATAGGSGSTGGLQGLLSAVNLQRKSLPKLASAEQKQNIEHLKSLMEKGILTQDEFNMKKKQLLGEGTVLEYDESHLSEDDKKKLDTLISFRKRGILSESEFQKEKKQILSNIGRQVKISSKQGGTSPRVSGLFKAMRKSTFALKKATASGSAPTTTATTASTTTTAAATSNIATGSGNGEQSYTPKNHDLSRLNATQLDQAKKLSQFVFKGIITQQEYDRKLSKMIEDANSNKVERPKTVLKQVATTGSGYVSAPAKSTVLFNENELAPLSNASKAEARRLQNLVAKNIVTIEEYRQKIQQMLAEEGKASQQRAAQQKQQQQPTTQTHTVSYDLNSLTEQQQVLIANLKDFVQKGILTPQEYEQKVQQMISQNTADEQIRREEEEKRRKQEQEAREAERERVRRELEERERQLELERKTAEAERIKREQEAEKLRLQREAEEERIRKEKEAFDLEMERLEKEYQEQQRREREAELERLRKEQEAEAERIETEARLERERLEKQKLEEKEKQRLLEALALEQKRKEEEAERLRREKEAERLEIQRREEQKRAEEKEAERKRREVEEQERLEKLRIENERLERERQLELERQEKERELELERIQKEQERLERETQQEQLDEERERRRRERILRGEPADEEDEEEYGEEEEEDLEEIEEEYLEEGEEVEYLEDEDDEIEFNDPVLDEIEMDEEQWDKIVALIDFVKKGFMSLEEYEESRNEILGIEVAYEDEDE